MLTCNFSSLCSDKPKMEFIPTVSMRYLIKHVIDCLKDPLFEGLLKTTKKSPKNDLRIGTWLGLLIQICQSLVIVTQRRSTQLLWVNNRHQKWVKSKKYNLIPVALLLTYCPWLLVFNSSKEYDLTYEGTKVCLCVVSLSSGSMGGFVLFCFSCIFLPSHRWSHFANAEFCILWRQKCSENSAPIISGLS